jgi:FlaA1/EpsC-like NDP-sugar epimerase
MFWHQLDRLLARLRPHRQPLSLLADGLVIALAWNFTYLFRLGFDRWFSARPSYDHWVMLAVVLLYLMFFKLAGIPRGMWRFSGFGEVQRLGWACLLAGAVAAVAVLMAQLTKVPRAVLALHPFMALMGLCMVVDAWAASTRLDGVGFARRRSRQTGGSRTGCTRARHFE